MLPWRIFSFNKIEAFNQKSLKGGNPDKTRILIIVNEFVKPVASFINVVVSLTNNIINIDL